MPRKKSRKKTSELAESTSPLWKVIATLGGISGIIAMILASIPIYQTERDRIEQDKADATRQIIAFEQLRILQEMATAQVRSASGDISIVPTVTALVAQLEQLEADKQALLDSNRATPIPDSPLNSCESAQNTYEALIKGFGSRQGDLIYDSRSDLDQNGQIDIFDYNILSTNWPAGCPS